MELKVKKRTVNYPTHTEDLHVPVPPQQYILDSDDEPTENRVKTRQNATSKDADFSADHQFKERIELHKHLKIVLIKVL
jgi:hypothetical protein